MNRFWTGGQSECRKALDEQYRDELDTLCARLNLATTEGERQEIEQQIIRLTTAYREKSRTVRRGLF